MKLCRLVGIEFVITAVYIYGNGKDRVLFWPVAVF